MSRVEEGTTQIIVTDTRLEFVNNAKKVRIQRDHGNTAHGRIWYTVETFYPAGLASWEQGSRMIMSDTSYDYEYKRLTEQVMGDEQALNPKHVSFKVFRALCEALV